MPAVKEMLAVAKRVLGYDLLQARSCLICTQLYTLAETASSL